MGGANEKDSAVMIRLNYKSEDFTGSYRLSQEQLCSMFDYFRTMWQSSFREANEKEITFTEEHMTDEEFNDLISYIRYPKRLDYDQTVRLAHIFEFLMISDDIINKTQELGKNKNIQILSRDLVIIDRNTVGKGLSRFVTIFMNAIVNRIQDACVLRGNIVRAEDHSFYLTDFNDQIFLTSRGRSLLSQIMSHFPPYVILCRIAQSIRRFENLGVTQKGLTDLLARIDYNRMHTTEIKEYYEKIRMVYPGITLLKSIKRIIARRNRRKIQRKKNWFTQKEFRSPRGPRSLYQGEQYTCISKSFPETGVSHFIIDSTDEDVTREIKMKMTYHNTHIHIDLPKIKCKYITLLSVEFRGDPGLSFKQRYTINKQHPRISFFHNGNFSFKLIFHQLFRPILT